MKRGNTKSKDARALRGRAEKRLSEQASPSAPPRSEAEARALVHELQVHQIELEMQNEDLVKAQAVAREAADNCAELFDFAPVAYFVLDADGVVCDLNLAAARLLGRDRSRVTNQRFERHLRPDQRPEYAGFCDKLRANGTQNTCELTLLKADGGFCDVLVEGKVVEKGGSAGAPGWRLAVMDITERRAAEARRNLSAALLEMFASKGSSQEYLAGVVEVIRQWSGCQAAGIRVTGAQGELPFAACAGYEPGFLEVENQFSLQRDDCCCLRTVKQAFGAPERTLVTSGGSFRCDDAVAFVGKLPPGTQARFEGNCVNFGFSSIAAIPLRCREEIIGVVHLADRRPGLFPPDRVAFLESLTPLIGGAIQRFQTDAKLAEYRDHLEELVRQRTSEIEATNAQLRQEIACRNVAEETLLRTAEELKRSNLELEQFAYAASHDLQEPLRAVGGFVRLIELRFPDKLDAKLREYIQGAAEGANRMEELITDLLALSRVGTQDCRVVSANLGAPLKGALQNLQFSIREAKAHITNDVLPTLRVDEGQMAQLFQNLIANALKFRKQTPPHIHIGARAEKGRWVIWVRDDGIGIDPQYFERIFQVFQRLHTRKKYPGTGIGLAICKKIVERHGGTIWVESQLGQGSTFYFSLPVESATLEAAT
jgi:PAS domain S-box-containing protein